MKNELIVLLVLTLLLLPDASAALTPQVTQTADIAIDAQSPVVYTVVPYDGGLVIVMTYTNVTPTGEQGGLYIYFLNGTTLRLIYETPISTVHCVYAFTQGGRLYVAFGTSHVVGLETKLVYQVKVLVFEGLDLVSSYVINGAYLSDLYNAPLYRVPAVMIVGGKAAATIMLNGTNVTLKGLTPIASFALPEGILVALLNVSQILGMVKVHAVPLNLTLYGYDGKIIWTKVYYFSPASLCSIHLGYSLDSPVPVQDYIAIVGDELFIFNLTTLMAPSDIGTIGNYVKVNATIVGISLENGTITTVVDARGLHTYTFLMNVGGKLYVATEGERAMAVYEFNGKSLVQATRVPLVTKTLPLYTYVSPFAYPNASNTYDAGQPQYGLSDTMYANSGIRVPASVFLYDPGKFLLILNPENNETNVTDIYPGGVLHYSLNGKVLDSFVAFDVVPLNVSGDLSLVFLNANGTVRGTIDLGKVASSPYYGLGVHVVQKGPNSYYVVAEYSNSSGNSVIVYRVDLSPHPVSEPLMTPLKSTVGTEAPQAPAFAPSALVIAAGAVTVVAMAVASLFLIRRR